MRCPEVAERFRSGEEPGSMFHGLTYSVCRLENQAEEGAPSRAELWSGPRIPRQAPSSAHLV